MTDWDLRDAEHTVMCLDHLRRAMWELKQAGFEIGRTICPDDGYRHDLLDLMMRIDGIDGLTETLKGIQEDAQRLLVDDPRCIYKHKSP